VVQFCAYRLARGELVLDLQSDILSHLPTRIVAPLVPESPGSDPPIGALEPVLEVEGTRMALLTTEMMAVPARLISGPSVASLADEDYVIRRALDMVFSGF
jgi:toxin CcdB